MKFEEVLPALRTGKKIRRTGRKKDIYISITIEGDCDHYVRYNFGSVFNFNKSDFENGDWEIVTEKKKVKLRDLTAEQVKKWIGENCNRGDYCKDCPFRCIECYDTFWLSHKDMFSDKFLDQEVEIED